MQIIKDDIFTINLKNILKFIAQDNKTKAYNFNSQLMHHINSVTNMPYKFRKSRYYHTDKVRDLIFKGYTIPYLIDEDKKFIVLLDIFKWIYRDTTS
jgi:toxin ParE1/3/4